MPALVRLVRWPYQRLLGYRWVRVVGAERARELWRAFAAGQVRLIVAFRHPYGNDPQVLTASVVKAAGSREVPNPFVQFVHGVEVGWWAGALARWALPRLGGLPVDHGRLASSQVGAIRDAILHGGHPLALAPEGQVTYSSRTVQRVEPGFARLGFLAADDLAAQGSPAHVLVLPVSFLQEYPAGTGKRLERVTTELERMVSNEPRTGSVSVRLKAVRDRALETAERWYAAQHGLPLTTGPWSMERLLPLLEGALTVAERFLGLSHEGEFFPRLYRIRTTGWERHFPTAAAWRTMTPLERRLAHRSLTDAWTAFRSMELADLAWYLAGEEPEPDSSTDFLADYAETLYDLLNRLAGGNISHRKVLFPRGMRTVFGQPIDLTARLEEYHAHRKETLEGTVQDLVTEWRCATVEDARG